MIQRCNEHRRRQTGSLQILVARAVQRARALVFVLRFYIVFKVMASMPYFNSEQRHYKKDTRFLLDLYTITYDNHESVDNICCLVSIFCSTYNYYSLYPTVAICKKLIQ